MIKEIVFFVLKLLGPTLLVEKGETNLEKKGQWSASGSCSAGPGFDFLLRSGIFSSLCHPYQKIKSDTGTYPVFTVILPSNIYT